MAFFGLTSYGVSDPIKFIMKPEYEEPATPEQAAVYINKDSKKPFYDAVREIDLHGGTLDGFSYRSFYRNSNFKQRGYRKPVGPMDMYVSPVCGSMDYGWWMTDPVLVNANWYKSNRFLPKPISEKTKFLDEALKTDRAFVL